MIEKQFEERRAADENRKKMLEEMKLKINSKKEEPIIPSDDLKVMVVFKDAIHKDDGKEIELVKSPEQITSKPQNSLQSKQDIYKLIESQREV